jgi:hypothetical protein
MRYDTPADARLRLDNSICLYKGEPVFVSTIREDLTAECIPCRADHTDQTIYVNANSDDLDITPPPMGFVNYRGDALYWFRNTMRQTLQGLSRTNTAFWPQPAVDWNIGLLQALGKTIKGEYPTVAEIFRRAKVNERYKNGAWSRDFALIFVGSIPLLAYRASFVGLINLNKNSVRLQGRVKVPAFVQKVSQYLHVE